MSTDDLADRPYYIGTKLVRAHPMTRGDFNHLRGVGTHLEDDPAEEGYLVEYTDGGKANVPGFCGYVSWSPKGVFERAYHGATNFDFGEAIRALKLGARVARLGWNGKGMWLALSPGVAELPADKFWAGPNRAYANSNPNGTAEVLPCITMKTATGEILMGWLASQSDMLAEDWAVVC